MTDYTKMNIQKNIKLCNGFLILDILNTDYALRFFGLSLELNELIGKS